MKLSESFKNIATAAFVSLVIGAGIGRWADRRMNEWGDKIDASLVKHTEQGKAILADLERKDACVTASATFSTDRKTFEVFGGNSCDEATTDRVRHVQFYSDSGYRIGIMDIVILRLEPHENFRHVWETNADIRKQVPFAWIKVQP